MQNDAAHLVAEGLLDVRAACHFLGVSRSFVYELMERGELQYVRLGRARRIPRRALVEFAASRLTGGQAD